MWIIPWINSMLLTQHKIWIQNRVHAVLFSDFELKSYVLYAIWNYSMELTTVGLVLSKLWTNLFVGVKQNLMPCWIFICKLLAFLVHRSFIIAFYFRPEYLKHPVYLLIYELVNIFPFFLTKADVYKLTSNYLLNQIIKKTSIVKLS